MPKWVIQILAPLACGALLLLGIIGLNTLLRSQSHSEIAFADIECDPPGKMPRDEFLTEVQYLANWPDQINLLDEGLAARLRLSFAVHPWVESVDRVEIVPPRRVRVALRYRVPVLAVSEEDNTAPPWIPPIHGRTKRTGRTVDRHGIVLPHAADDRELPTFGGELLSASPARTGQQWGEQNVVAAAAAAGVLAPHQSELRLKRFEVDGGVVLIWDDRAERTKIIWGPVKDDTPGEAKLQALLNVHAEHGSLDGLEVDIRAPDSPVVRPIKRP